MNENIFMQTNDIENSTNKVSTQQKRNGTEISLERERGGGFISVGGRRERVKERVKKEEKKHTNERNKKSFFPFFSFCSLQHLSLLSLSSDDVALSLRLLDGPSQKLLSLRPLSSLSLSSSPQACRVLRKAAKRHAQAQKESF